MKRVFTQTFGVVGAIIECDGLFVLVKEAYRKGPDYGKWNHPAGWIDPGENPIEAVKREVHEETGSLFTPTGILGIYSLVRSDIKDSYKGLSPHGIKIIFRGVLSKDQGILSDDVSEVRWFSRKEIEAMDQATLRDDDIKQMVRDYYGGQYFPLCLFRHTVQEKRG